MKAHSLRALVALLARCALLAALPGAADAIAADRLVNVESRPGVKLGYYWMERPDATATVVLLMGGKGSIGMRDGAPTSENFLVRNRDRFAAAGFDVAVVGRPSDQDDLTLIFRTSDSHMADLKAIVERVRRDGGKPVWLVGTSRGTTSAAAGAIALGDAIVGVVLTSSITDASLPGAVQNMPLADIHVPVLVMHHRNDACRSTPPRFAQSIVDKLTGTTTKRLLLVEGGSGARGDPCEPLHYHGFIGMDQEAVDAIAQFVRDAR